MPNPSSGKENQIDTVAFNLIYLALEHSIPVDEPIDQQKISKKIQYLCDLYHLELSLFIQLVTKNAMIGNQVHELQMKYPDLKNHYNNKNSMEITVNEQIATMSAVENFLNDTHAMLEDFDHSREVLQTESQAAIASTLQWMLDTDLEQANPPPVILKNHFDNVIQLASRMEVEAEKALAEIAGFGIALTFIQDLQAQDTKTDGPKPVLSLADILSGVQQSNENQANNKSGS